MKFKRSAQGGKRNTKDSQGRCIVRIHRVVDGTSGDHLVGNITKSFSLADAKVSDVARVIEAALFGGK